MGLFNPSMLFPFDFCCSTGTTSSMRTRHQERKLELLRFWRDAAERRLAALDAAISTLNQQIERDRGAVS